MLKKHTDYRVVGQSIPRADIPDKVTAWRADFHIALNHIAAFKPPDLPLLAATETGLPKPGNRVGFLFQNAPRPYAFPFIAVNTHFVAETVITDFGVMTELHLAKGFGISAKCGRRACRTALIRSYAWTRTMPSLCWGWKPIVCTPLIFSFTDRCCARRRRRCQVAADSDLTVPSIHQLNLTVATACFKAATLSSFRFTERREAGCYCA